MAKISKWHNDIFWFNTSNHPPLRFITPEFNSVSYKSSPLVYHMKCASLQTWNKMFISECLSQNCSSPQVGHNCSSLSSSSAGREPRSWDAIRAVIAQPGPVTRCGQKKLSLEEHIDNLHLFFLSVMLRAVPLKRFICIFFKSTYLRKQLQNSYHLEMNIEDSRLVSPVGADIIVKTQGGKATCRLWG